MHRTQIRADKAWSLEKIPSALLLYNYIHVKVVAKTRRENVLKGSSLQEKPMCISCFIILQEYSMDDTL